MTTFASLPSLARALFALWSLLLALAGIVNLLLALQEKRFLFSAFALLLFLPAYLMWQVIFDLSRSIGAGAAAAAFSQRVTAIAWAWWSVALAALTLGAGLLLDYNLRYERNHITPNSIKSYLDEMPCGVCCWHDSGRVLFSNICMNRLCALLTDGPLRNGNHFYEAVAGGMRTADGKMWRFTCHDIVLGGEHLHEMIATDITTEYAKTQALEQDKAELARINRALEDYTLGIDETVRRQEILQAKVNIHDEMNRLMLSTMAAEGDDAETLDRIFALWEQNALLLCLEAERTEDTEAVRRIERLAEALKIRLIWQQPMPALRDEQRALLRSAAQEAIANAAKHAGATTMAVSFDMSDEGLYCRFTSDGRMPAVPVRFTGGLANLARLAEKQGASVSVSVTETFTLSLCFPPENTPNGGCTRVDPVV